MCFSCCFWWDLIGFFFFVLQTRLFQGHFTLFGWRISADVSSGVGSVYVELAFQALLLSRTIVAFDLSSLNRPILQAPVTRSIQTLPSDVCVPHSKRYCICSFRKFTLFLHRSFTSNTPKHLPSRPTTPASSKISLTAVSAFVSSCSTPPPGTIHLSGYLLDDTSRTCLINERALINKQ